MPSGTSHNTCKATVGHAAVNLWTWPASENFSSMVLAAGWTNFPNRVPVSANPHEGSSIARPFNAPAMVSVRDEAEAGAIVYLSFSNGS